MNTWGIYLVLPFSSTYSFSKTEFENRNWKFKRTWLFWSNREIFYSYFTAYAESEFQNFGVLPLKWKFHFRFYISFTSLLHRFWRKEKVTSQKQLVDKYIFIMVFQKFMWIRPFKRSPNTFLFLSLDVLHIYHSGCQILLEELIFQRSYRSLNMSSIFLLE